MIQGAFMTMPIRFDTQQYIKTLMAEGCSQEQAEAQAQALTTALGEGTVASSELLMVKLEMLSRMELVKVEILAAVDRKLQPLYLLHGIQMAALIAILLKLYG
jgi:hypothetical protein